MGKTSLEYYKDLVLVLTQKELKVRYKRSFLGYLWSIANPLALALVFFVAFKIFMKIPIENYTLFLIAGLFPWQWFLNSVNSSAMVFIGNATLIKKMHFRHEVLIVATILNDMLHFILSIPVIILFLFIYGMQPSFMWFVGIPVLLILQFVITMGFSLAVAALNLFFRDIERIVFIFTSLMFYMTPIIYSEEMVPAEYKTLILSNPLSILFISWRNLLMHGILNLKNTFLAFIYALIVFSIGYLVYRKLKWRFAEVL